jgi:hypothetical protein
MTQTLRQVMLCGLIATAVLLQGCVHKLVTVPLKVAYKTTKYAVKGTAAVVGAVVPDGDDEKTTDEKK